MSNCSNKYLVFILLLGLTASLEAQSDTSALTRTLARYKIKASLGMQLWTTYTNEMEVYQSASQQYERVDNRINSQLRRTRLSIKGRPYENLSVNLTAALDLVGKDLLSATEAGANNGASPNFRLWNAFVQWRLLPGREQLHLVVGYQVPQIGRESMTGALSSTSFEKAWSQNYLRRHLTGIGPGRAVGINLGGLWHNKTAHRQLEYQLGIFNPVFEALGGNSTGPSSSPLIVVRGALHIGDPESTHYSISHKINYFGNRKGISLGFSVARQGRTALFQENGAIGGDVLLNYGRLNIDGAIHRLYRRSDSVETDLSLPLQAGTGHVRISYNVNLPKGMVLEPVAMYWFFQGPMNAEDQERALQMKSFAGEDASIDLGGNLYWNPDFKISLHYTWRWGQAGAATAGNSINNYFSQPALGAIRRGDWLGLGMVLTI